MKRIIVNFDEQIPDDLALRLVKMVIGQGRISNNGKQYCYHTTCRVGDGVFNVSASRTESGTDTFSVHQEPEAGVPAITLVTTRDTR
jgi:hypothetical protein